MTATFEGHLRDIIHGRTLDVVAIAVELRRYARQKYGNKCEMPWFDSQAIQNAIDNLMAMGAIKKVGERDGYNLYAVPRKNVPDRDLLAMFICQWKDHEGNPAIDLDWAKTATSREIIDRFRATHQIDHFPTPRVWGGRDHATNYLPLKTAAHREKTAKYDAKVIAKVRRAEKKRAEAEAGQSRFRSKVLAKSSQLSQINADEPNRHERPGTKRKWPKQKMGYRKFDGTPVRPGERPTKKE